MLMESLPFVLSSFPPLQNPSKTNKSLSSKPAYLLPNSVAVTTSAHSSSIHVNLPQNHLSFFRNSPLLQTLTKTHLSLTMFDLFTSLPCLASETETAVSSAEPVSDRINLESILISIDDFFNRYPFFVATCTFIWLVVIPVTQYYFSKCKFISAIDAFRRLRDDPNAQLLDIRNTKTLVSLGSPNLKSLNKIVVQVQFTEEDEDAFVKSVLDNFADPANTVLYVLDNFYGNSLNAAQFLFKNGFKEAYAIKGGVRGKKGWMEIQETLLPPSLHILPNKKKKKVKVSQKLGINGVNQAGDKNEASSSYTDMKPPSSPTPSKL